MAIYKYKRDLVLNYAELWAKKRNSFYYDFSFLGGDCTNFASQCLFAGAPFMNYTQDLGWYYKSVSNRAPAWTGVEFFYNFLIGNFKGISDKSGPFAKDVNLSELEIGDFIQLGDANSNYYHTPVVVGFDGTVPLLAAHSKDVFGVRLDYYNYSKLRCIKVLGARG